MKVLYALTDLPEALLQAPELQDEVELLSPGVGQSHQAVQQLVHLLVQSRHRLHRCPLVFTHTQAALLPAKPRKSGSTLLLQLYQSAVFKDATHHRLVPGQQ